MAQRKKVPLPLVDQSRTEFGVSRTVCSCRECVANCRFLPGYLIPADLGRLIPAEADPEEWAREHLLASPGALVGDQQSGRTWRIPTLVPARAQNGACIFLDKRHRCRVHTVSPFGCAFFDHRSGGQELSLKGLRTVNQAQRDPESLYHRLWHFLHAAGLVAPSPEEARARLNRHLAEKEVPWWKRKKRRS